MSFRFILIGFLVLPIHIDTSPINSTEAVMDPLKNHTIEPSDRYNKGHLPSTLENITTKHIGIENTSSTDPHEDLAEPHPPEAVITGNWTGVLLYRDYSNDTAHAHGLRERCQLITTDHRASTKLQDLLMTNTALVEYTMTVLNYTDNPLSNNSYLGYKSHVWSRIVSPQGQTILNLAFNYDIMSLMTLSFGIQKVGATCMYMLFGL